MWMYALVVVSSKLSFAQTQNIFPGSYDHQGIPIVRLRLIRVYYPLIAIEPCCPNPKDSGTNNISCTQV